MYVNDAIKEVQHKLRSDVATHTYEIKDCQLLHEKSSDWRRLRNHTQSWTTKILQNTLSYPQRVFPVLTSG